MGKRFDEIKETLKHVNKEQVAELIEEIKLAREDGKIDENEKKELLASAKARLGDLKLGGLFE